MGNHSKGQKSRALMATGRVANLPTVWSNVMVAFWMVSVIGLQMKSTILVDSYFYLILISLTASLLYVGACMLGDCRDIAFDTKHRPSRPLPSGVLSVNTVATTSYALILWALLNAVMTWPFTIVKGLFPDSLFLLSKDGAKMSILQANPIEHLLVIFALFAIVLIYAYLHKKLKKLAIVNMAACRFMLIIFATSAAIAPYGYQHFTAAELIIPVIFALAVAIYTLLLSSVASTESTPEHYRYRKTLQLIWFGLPFVCLIIISKIGMVEISGTAALTVIASLLIYIAWGYHTFQALNTSKPTFVSRALAGFCILDACFAATISLPITLLCLGFFCLALLLQKIAPAT